jgi:hypothetical protein
MQIMCAKTNTVNAGILCAPVLYLYVNFENALLVGIGLNYWIC